eukprot:GFUD01018150.1.p1 GENE.GFUD01018150.1~~GFUD01018150.1.p1  ORF type:complete len:386 (+),score=116.97 GFUD01018150.1:68-1225(+)
MMILTKLRLINRFSPPLVHFSRGYRLPPNFVSYLDNFSKDFNNQNNSIVNSFEELKGKLAEHAELETMKKNTTDNEFVEMAAADMEDVSEDIEELVEEISFKLVPSEKHDDENALIEVVPGAGGQEASLFAEEIFNLYLGYCEIQGCKVEMVEVVKNIVSKNTKVVSNTGIIKGVARVLAEGGTNQVFRLLKFESGVHRVQRVPVTGSKADRLQTSTCSVAVLPEPRTVVIEISEKDLKWEFMRAGGAGGQGVNTADSAVRLTHLPTNTAVESQEERAQAQNKQRAMKKLRSLLFQQEWGREQMKVATSRKLQVGTMNRNEKIRTYNFNRHMVTDHRLSQSRTVPSIQQWFMGGLGYDILKGFREELELVDRSDRLDQILTSKQI